MQTNIRRTVFVLVASGLLVVLTVGMAWAINVDCVANTQPLCVGGPGNDDFTGEDLNDGVNGARDIIKGKG